MNHYQQSVSNPRIYPIGDCAASGYQLATVADEEGKTAAHNILNGNSKSVDYSVVPSTVFTIPRTETELSRQPRHDHQLAFIKTHW